MRDVSEVLPHYCGVTLRPQDNGSILSAVRGAGTWQYALATRILLQSLVFHKRFAESILGVQATDYTGEDTASADEQEQGG